MEPSVAVDLEQKLAECRDRVLLADQYAQAVGMLGYAVNPAEPPEGHKSRFAARLAGTPRPAVPATGTTTPRAMPPRAHAPAPPVVEIQQRLRAPVIDLPRERARRASR